MRTLKFRAWNPDKKSMSKNWTWDEWLNAAAIAGVWNSGHWILQQYTGLKDNLGVEVYEGDVVAIYPLEKEIHATVEQQLFGWCFKHKDGTETSYMSPELFRVIGNIYETPDLLKDYGGGL